MLEAGHWRVPLESPWSRQPELQHCAWQQSLAKHASPLQVCPSSWLRAPCPAGHKNVPATAVAVESRKPASQHVPLPLFGAPQHSASLHPPVLHSGQSPVRYSMLAGHAAAPPSVYPAPEHVCRQQSDSVHAPLLRDSVDQHSVHSPRNVAPAAHVDWLAKVDRLHLSLQHSEDCAHCSPQS